MTRSNTDVAAALHEIADLLELKGENRFRVASYRRAADAVDALTSEICEMPAAELTTLRAIGKGLAAAVKEFCETGRIALLDRLRSEIPPGMRELTLLPGVGPKRAMLAFAELGISTVEELGKAAAEHRLREVKGFGPRFEEQILEAIARGDRSAQRVLLARALPLAEAIVSELGSHPAVAEGVYGGSVRRMQDTVGDLDVLAVSDDPGAVMAAFESLRGMRSSHVDEETKASAITTRGLRVDLRVAAPHVFGAAFQDITGSWAHNTKLRDHASAMGMELSEYGLFDARTHELIATPGEEDLYARLGMPWIPPTMREDLGEVEAALAGELPRVVTEDLIRGDLQSHSTYSDGRLSVRDMAAAAAGRGYEYFAVTDHGPRLHYMRNLTPADIDAQRGEVVDVNRELEGRMTLLHGIELNIGADGSLDYPDEVLATFDICVASIHSQFQLSRADQTRRLLRAISNPHVHVIGHPSGRRLDRREGIEFDVAEVARSAARHHVALEINAHPWRLDLRDTHIRQAREHGVAFVISTDAHSIVELDNMRFGVATAQRGWVEPGEVINTWPIDRMRAFLVKR